MQAFERTIKEARFAMVMVDAPNLSADDLKSYWSRGQVSNQALTATKCVVHLCMCTERLLWAAI